MTRYMLDAVDVGNIPAGWSGLVAGYETGALIPSTLPALNARFPTNLTVSIAVTAAEDANVLDVESGDASPANVPAWVTRRRSAGADPTIYTSTGNWPAVKAACAAAGVELPWWWAAQWDGVDRLVDDPKCVAKQYTNGTITDAPNNMPGCDTSVVADYWPGVDAGVVQVAQGEVGYTETGNATKYWAALDPARQGQNWCAAFVSWCFTQAGRPLPAIDTTYGFVWCPDAVAWAKTHSAWSASGHYAPGDVILYSFDGTGNATHTGIVVSDDGVTLHTIEGNVFGGVRAMTRSHGPQVLGVLQTGTLPAQPIGDDMPIFQVTDGPMKDAELFDFGYGPAHIDGPMSQALTAAGVRLAPVSDAEYQKFLAPRQITTAPASAQPVDVGSLASQLAAALGPQIGQQLVAALGAQLSK